MKSGGSFALVLDTGALPNQPSRFQIRMLVMPIRNQQRKYWKQEVHNVTGPVTRILLPVKNYVINELSPTVVQLNYFVRFAAVVTPHRFGSERPTGCTNVAATLLYALTMSLNPAPGH